MTRREVIVYGLLEDWSSKATYHYLKAHGVPYRKRNPIEYSAALRGLRTTKLPVVTISEFEETGEHIRRWWEGHRPDLLGSLIYLRLGDDDDAA